MRIDFITPFLEATEEIIQELLSVEPQRGEMELQACENILCGGSNWNHRASHWKNVDYF